MGYYIDGKTVSLDDVRHRLQNTDLIPSQEPLLVDIKAKMVALKKAGIGSVADLRGALKGKKPLDLLSGTTGIDSGYLVVLRRAVEGFFPKPRPLKEIDWLDQDAVGRLNKIGVKNTKHLFEAAQTGVSALADAANVPQDEIGKFLEIADLCRIQWLSPNYARVLVAAGYPNVAEVVQAKPDVLYEAMIAANHGAKFYKGTVGRRDVKRLVVAAGYVS